MTIGLFSDKLVYSGCLKQESAGILVKVNPTTRKEWFIIDSQGIEKTEKMEQAFRGVHGYGLNEYQNDPQKILEVEQRREQDYRQGQSVAAKIERQAHRE